jgi:hypothetical protein
MVHKYSQLYYIEFDGLGQSNKVAGEEVQGMIRRGDYIKVDKVVILITLVVEIWVEK